MKSTFFAALIATVTLAKPNLSDLHKYTFQEFIKDFNLELHHGT